MPPPTGPPPMNGFPPPAGTTAVDPALYNSYPYSTVGKVFITQGGVDYVCSGSSTGNNVVTTAGHCIADFGRFSTNFVYVPEYRNGAAPFGMWVGTDLRTTSEWFNNEDFGRDIGFARVMNMNAGGTLQQTVGALSLTNCALGQPVVIAGYPAGNPFNGEVMITTNTQISVRDNSVSPATNGARSSQTGGSSGGPWIPTGTGNQICSVVSYSYGNDGMLYGPQIDAYILGIHDQLL